MQDMPETGKQPDSIETIAKAINKSGMTGPAALALHVGRPLAWIGGQMLWAIEPFLGAGGSSRRGVSLQGIATLLEREDGVDELIRHLDGTPQDRKEQHEPRL